MRAADCAKPEKEAGFVSAVTKAGFFMTKIVGHCATVLHAAEIDVAVKEFVSYICNEYNKQLNNELPNESKDSE